MIKKPFEIVYPPRSQDYYYQETKNQKLDANKKSEINTGPLTLINNQNINFPHFLNDKMIGINGGLKALFRQISKIINLDENILITGETGTGKEMLARAIHFLSNRKVYPFIKINCGAIPENLMESELFGFNKGAFSQAFSEKPGKIEQANNGTLFLDEIGELKPDMQTRLLQVIQEKQVERLGSNRAIQVNFQLICATNQNLQVLLEKKLFRQDLYFRMNTFTFTIPPLRERQDDIEPLIHYLINKYCKIKNRSDIKIKKDVLNKLKNYHWPGNIRELENVLKKVVYLLDETEDSITAEHFDFLRGQPDTSHGPLSKTIDRICQAIINEEYDLKKIELQILDRILKYFNGNILTAARTTQISKNRFYRNRNLFKQI